MIVPRLQEFLDEKRAIYEHCTYHIGCAGAVTNVVSPPGSKVARTVVFFGDGLYALAVLPAYTRVDLDKLRRALGLTSIRLASEEERRTLFPDSEVDAIPPFGNLYDHTPVYVDESLAANDGIAFSAGTKGRHRTNEFQRSGGAGAPEDRVSCRSAMNTICHARSGRIAQLLSFLTQEQGPTDRMRKDKDDGSTNQD